MPLISVIIPTHNRLPRLQKAVASVLGQSLDDFELLIVDDGSEDGTQAWAAALAHEKIRYFRQAQAGPAAARNLGLRHAAGKWIAFLDSDDEWLPKKLKVQIDFLHAHPDYLACQSEEIWIRNGLRVNPKKKHAKPSGWIFEACTELCLISPSSVMIEKRLLLELGGFDPSFAVCEDYELWLRLSLQTPVRTLPEAYTIKHGGHSDQLSRQEWGMDRWRIRALEKTLSEQKLTDSQTQAAQDSIRRKLEVLALGFAKRYPEAENPYREKLLRL